MTTGSDPGPAPRTVFIHEYVTGGGLAGRPLPETWAAEGSALRRALAEDFSRIPGVRVVVTLDDRFDEPPGPWSTVRVGPGREGSAFSALASGADWTLVIAPETGGILADRARMVEGVGGRSLGSLHRAVEACADKARLGRELAGRGVSTPETAEVDPRAGLPGAFPYPAVLKPADGAGSIDTFIVTGPGLAPEGASRMGPAILQPFVEGTPASASFLVTPGGLSILVGVARQAMTEAGGRLSYGGGAVPAGDPSWADEPRRALSWVSGLRGWVGVDFIRDDRAGRCVVLEINPRPTTSYVGLRRLLPPGALAGAWLSAMGDEPGEALGLSRRVLAGPALRFDASGAVEAIETVGVAP